MQVELTPMAIAAGRRLSDRLFGGVEGAKADYANVPVRSTVDLNHSFCFVRARCCWSTAVTLNIMLTPRRDSYAPHFTLLLL